MSGIGPILKYRRRAPEAGQHRIAARLSPGV